MRCNDLKNSLEYAFIKRPIKNEKSTTLRLRRNPFGLEGEAYAKLIFYSRFDKTQNDSQQYRPL
jgi:hypothetical protein